GFSLGAIFSPLLGAWLLPGVGMRGLFLIAFVFFVLSTGALALMSPQRPPARRAVATSPTGRRRELLIWTALFVAASWGSAVLRPFLSPYLEDVLGLARPWILASSALLALGEVVLAPSLGRIGDRDGPRALARGLALMAAGCLLLFVGTWAVVPAMFLLGGDRVTGSLFRSTIGRWAGARRGLVFGSTLVLANAAQALGPLAGARLYALNPAGPLLLAAGLAAVIGLLAWALRARDRAPR
ncbi:MAG: MFS transporter, partial [Candidatus Bipolaricaulota bacterium]